MGVETLGLAILALLGVMLLLGTPLAFAIGATAVIVGVIQFGPQSLIIIPSRIYDLITNYALVAVPLFILMGLLLERSGIPEAMFRPLQRWTRLIPGGLGLGTIVLSAILAAMVGVIGAEIVILGLTALPAMLSLGYHRRLALGLICAGGSLGSLIPPGVVLILYGVFANVSIGDLFIAAMTPGLLYAGMYAGYVIVICSLRPEMTPQIPRRAPSPSAGAVADAGMPNAAREVTAFALPCTIIGLMLCSLYLGIATPTEVAAIGVFAALIAAAVRRRLSVDMLRDSLRQTGESIGRIIFVFFGATALVSYFNLAGGTAYFESLLRGLPLPPLGIVLVMMAVWFVLGFVLDFLAILFLTMPVFVPVIKALGLDPIWFGVLFCMNMQMSYLTPPFGPAVFYLKSVTPPEISLEEIFRSVWPFVVLQAIGLSLVLLFPKIALWPVG